ncbi:RNA helicase [Recurvomyces mirabilis]|uniref:RNA helicase n=1 Tax=Recurvomyces mirabilis TaxID=574656 RepID=A0AAE0WUC6_9PEZI|nr:RNA helicase [Recurvomyces mirabilis]KAK5160508.1 RNA helicase [Recurvomyces mirabilis]
MLPTQRHTGRCIYCAFRTQQLALQARRLKSSTANKTFRFNEPERSKPAFRRIDAKRDVQTRRPGRNDDHASNGYRGDGKVKRLTDVGFHFENGKFMSKTSGRGQGDPNFMDALHKRMDELKGTLEDAPLLEHLREEDESEGGKAETFKKIWAKFRRDILSESDGNVPWIGAAKNEGANTLRQDLREAFRTRGNNGLDDKIKYAFYAHVTGSRFTPSDIKNQMALADLRYPAEWFPATRALHRTVHLHVGPTNSGKTYHALQRLEKAEKGVYAGPLRLLAHEVYSRMNAKGRSCSLITGEERRSAAVGVNLSESELAACTVEMMPLNKSLDVAVIDEIQMIGNNERGWAWTQALMGVKAKEVHLCGEERTVQLITELCASVGDKLEIHRYERLSPLKVADTSLEGDLRRLRKGIHALRKQIEQQTGKKVAIVYGSLPPETRAQQARLFNDPDNDYDYLVASDAVGMGLNLAIKRIIFESSSKFDGTARRTLGVADIKQIAGRAGRYRTAAFNAATPTANQDLAAAKGDSPVEALPPPASEHQKEDKNENIGLVTTIEPFDYPIVAAAMASEPEPIRTAGIFPPSSVLVRFASYFPPGTPFSYILIRLHELSQMHSRFHLCGLKEQLWIADLIEPIQGLTVGDRNVICSSPCSRGDEMWKNLMPAFARCIAEQSGGSIVDIEELPLEILELEPSASREYLRELERLHKGIVTYLWLSYRFAGIFSTRALAMHVKGLVEEKIEQVLAQFSFSEQQRRKNAAKREKMVLREMERAAEEVGRMEEGARMAVEDEGAAVRGSESGAKDEASLAVDTAEVGNPERGSMLAGGDHFTGAEDLELGDPAEQDIMVVDPAAASSFAQWRAQQTKRMDQSVNESTDNPMAAAHAEGEDTATQAAREGETETSSVERPSSEDVLVQEKAVTELEGGKEAEAQFTPETKMNDSEEETPAVTKSQGTSPQPGEGPMNRQEQSTSEPASAFSTRTLPKHLGLNVNAERSESQARRPAHASSSL